MNNSKLYIKILVCCIAFTLLSAVISDESPWFTILTGLGCGGTASAAVAWLVEKSNWESEQRRLNALRSIVLQSFFTEFDSGSSGFVQICYLSHAVKGSSPEMTWHEWCQMAFECVKEKPKHIPNFVTSCYALLRNIDSQARSIEAQKSSFLAEGFVKPEDIRTIEQIVQLNDYLKITEPEQNSEKYDLTHAESLKFYMDIIFGYLKNADALAKANEMKVGTIMFKALKVMNEGVESLTQETLS